MDVFTPQDMFFWHRLNTSIPLGTPKKCRYMIGNKTCSWYILLKLQLDIDLVKLILFHPFQECDNDAQCV